MSVIQFLERLGRGSSIDFSDALGRLDVEPEVRDALAGGDSAALARLLDGRARMWCLIATPGDEPQESPGEPDGDDDDQEAPAKEE